MLVLGIETSCDETAAALLQNGRTVRSSVVATQEEVHRPYGGVVPELACRTHVRVIHEVVRKTLERGDAALGEIDLIAATAGPGLVGALLVGLSFAKALAFSLEKPLVPVNHLEGHLLSIFLEEPHPSFPFLSLLVSGGHTELVHVTGFGKYRVLGRTRDDAAGEAFDKVAKMLGLGYPGGPAVERISAEGNPEAVDFPKSRLKGNPLDLSFSGIKTAVKNFLTFSRSALAFDPSLPGVGEGGPEGNGKITRADVAASFQKTAVDMLAKRVLEAAEVTRSSRVVVTGGVACNRLLRENLNRLGRERGFQVYFPSPRFCTDNAAMIALAGYETFRRLGGDLSSFGDPLLLDADPGLTFEKS